MAYIRERTEEKTCYQSGSHIDDSVDNNVDVALVYRIDDTLPERIEAYRSRGYVIHLMTGISWGKYTDYLYGEYDGINHWSEAQCDRFGNTILHSPDVPYMVPTISFCDYLTEKLKIAVDLGVEAIHVEEPEFWDRAGYSESFKREYEIYYRAPWQAPHTSVDARNKCARLKAFLYARAIDRISASLKEYSLTKYGKALRFYVPTHSLLNYTQWKIVSPEGKLCDIPGVDGCIAQVWTGTSREKNLYNGVLKERTFETAFLEYGVMQELVRGTGRRMWFLHDPIEDCPEFDWDDYKQNYLKTVTASLMHTRVSSYEVCPWPTRVFGEKYPKNSPEGVGISEEYRTILNNNFNTLGDMPTASGNDIKIGILMADSQLYQREYPDSEFTSEADRQTGTVLLESEEMWKELEEKLFPSPDDNRELMLKFMSSKAFPAFYGLSLPLLKNGIPVCPVLLDNVRRYPGYLDDYDVILMSYEYMKPDFPDVNAAIAAFVRNGGKLIYAGDGFDPYHKINSWWQGKYETPAEHLFEMLGISAAGKKSVTPAGKGFVGVLKVNPAKFLFNKEGSETLLSFVNEVLANSGEKLSTKNNLIIKRSPYIVAAALDENEDSTPLSLNGLFADMYTPDFRIITEKIILPGENTLLYDLGEIKDSVAIIGTSVRINSLTQDESKIIISAHGALCKANIRLKTDFEPVSVTVNGCESGYDYDKQSKTLLISFPSEAKPVTIEING